MPIPLALPIVGGAVLLVGTALALRKKKIPPGVAAAATGPGAQLSPRQEAAIQAPLPVQVQQVLKTRGPDPDQATINSLKVLSDAGTLDVASLLKGTDGTVFVKTSPQMQGQSIPNDIAEQILAGDKLTVDIGGAGMQIPAIGAGNMLMLAKSNPNMSAGTITAVSIDPRVPDNGPVLTIPLKSITGIQPGS
jgi:hypothetical protein